MSNLKVQFSEYNPSDLNSLPTLNIYIDDVHICLESNSNKEFILFDNITLDESHVYKENEEFPPEYAFILSNGSIQLRSELIDDCICLSLYHILSNVSYISIKCTEECMYQLKELILDEFTNFSDSACLHVKDMRSDSACNWKIHVENKHKSIINPYTNIVYDCTMIIFKDTFNMHFIPNIYAYDGDCDIEDKSICDSA